MDETPSNGVEAMVRDAVSEQKAKGLIPTPNAVKDYILPIVEEGERRTEASRLRIKPKAPEITEPTTRRSTPEMEAELKKRLGRDVLPGSSDWVETRKPSAPPRKQLIDKREAIAKTRMRKRLRLLWSLPDWREKLMQVNPLAINGQLGVEKQNHAHAVIRTIVADSDRLFGPWLADPKKKLHFT